MLKQGLTVKPLVMGILFTARIALAAAVRFKPCAHSPFVRRKIKA